MDIPKPHPPVKPVVVKTEAPKKPFVPKPHLTQRPFADNEAFAALKQVKRNTTRKNNNLKEKK